MDLKGRKIQVCMTREGSLREAQILGEIETWKEVVALGSMVVKEKKETIVGKKIKIKQGNTEFPTFSPKKVSFIKELFCSTNKLLD